MQILLLAMLPAAGNFFGGLLSEVFPLRYHTLSIALHAATGVLFAVIGIELMPRALQAEPPWIIILAFIMGGLAFLLLDHMVGLIRARTGESKEGDGTWGIVFAVSLDLFSDGLMIGASTIIHPSLGLLLALGQVTADLPEGFATNASFRSQGISRRKRFLMMSAFILPVIAGAVMGYFLVRDRPPVIQYAILALTAGILLTTVVEEIIPEAHKEEDARMAALALVGGFALFSLVSVYLV